MKLRYFQIAIVSLFLLTSQQAYTQEASFEETEAWLNEKLANNFTLYKSVGKTFTYDYKSVIKDCKCTSTVYETMDNRESNVYVIFSFNFKNFMDDKIYKFQSDKGFALLTLFVSENRNLVNRKVVWADSHKVESQSIEDKFEIHFQSDELAERVNKAFERYIKLCKDKKEKF